MKALIVGEGKPLSQIKEMIDQQGRVLILGCNTCVTICMAGGEKEVAILASALRLSGIDIAGELTVQRQCDKEFLSVLEESSYDCILSMACGSGVQFVNEMFPQTPVYPALNTSFMGVNDDLGRWSERCQSCGECILDKTGGVCAITRCSKSLLNGPCGGSQDGKCEVDADTDCAWQLIYDRLKLRGQLEKLEEIYLPKNWSTSRDGGPRRRVREDIV